LKKISFFQIFPVFLLLILPLIIFPYLNPEVLKPLIGEIAILLLLILQLFCFLKKKEINFPSLFHPFFLPLVFVYFLLMGLKGVSIFAHPEGYLPLFYILFLSLNPKVPTCYKEGIIMVSGVVAIIGVIEKIYSLPRMEIGSVLKFL